MLSDALRKESLLNQVREVFGVILQFRDATVGLRHMFCFRADAQRRKASTTTALLRHQDMIR
jgi:hypothetical protein